MTLFFCSHFDIDLDEEFGSLEDKNTVEQFINLYKESSQLLEDFNKDRVKIILINLIYLGHLLGYEDNELIEACIKKIERNKSRFATVF